MRADADAHILPPEIPLSNPYISASVYVSIVTKLLLSDRLSRLNVILSLLITLLSHLLMILIFLCYHVIIFRKNINV